MPISLTKILAPIIAIALFSSFPAAAADLAKLLKSEPEQSEQTPHNLFDLERCMIEVDATQLPTVYRQPDRPETVFTAWDGGHDGLSGIKGVAKLEGVAGAKVTYWGSEKILRRITPCITNLSRE